MRSEGEIIVAPATASGGALAVVRLSGEGSIALCDRFFRGRSPLSEAPSHTLRFGALYDGEEMIDEVVLALFRAPHSYTGEESVEISCHGSSYIQRRIIELVISHGARMATAGEFSMRAYMNGRLDLSQAEAVGDLIAAESAAAHTLALRQMRGHYSQALDSLRNELIHLSSLLELELDFSEEEVEFADRETLERTMRKIGDELKRLEGSFRLGNVLREGVQVAIVGRPNVGKSTLLNRLSGEERALVSEIAGTTRDTIEQTIQIDGLLFRFIDTAGLHATSDRLEQMGIERTRAAIDHAHVVLCLMDANDPTPIEIPPLRKDQILLRVANKCDLNPAFFSAAEVSTSPLSATGQTTEQRKEHIETSILAISAKTGAGIDNLRQTLRATIDTSELELGSTIVSNSRHLEALTHARLSLDAALSALAEGLPTDLQAEELRQVAHHLGTITGAITSDDLLHSIFANFCIGK